MTRAADYDKLVLAVKKFLIVYDMLLPEVNNALHIAHIHGAKFSGKHWGVELAAMRDLVSGVVEDPDFPGEVISADVAERINDVE